MDWDAASERFVTRDVIGPALIHNKESESEQQNRHCDRHPNAQYASKPCLNACARLCPMSQWFDIGYGDRPLW
jgi:hypothetical protein